MTRRMYWGLAILITVLVDTTCVVFLLHKPAPQK